MSEVFDVKKAFEVFLQRIDELIDGMRSERDRIKAEFKHRLETVRFGRVDWERFEGFFEEPCITIPKRPNEWYVVAPSWLDLGFNLGLLCSTDYQQTPITRRY